jgi:hypothetical protein
MFLRNVCIYLQVHTALQPRRTTSNSVCKMGLCVGLEYLSCREIDCTFFKKLYEIRGSLSDEHAYGGLLGCDAMWTRRWLPVLLRNILPTSSVLKYGESLFLQYGTHLQVHMASQLRRPP